MRPFSYVRAKTAENACDDAAAHPGSAYLAGGTTLVDLMKIDVLKPDRLIDITKLGNTQIKDHNGGLLIGALATNSDVAHDQRVIQRYPVLSKALLSGASAQLRNMATVGGNLMQKTRCYYYRNSTMPCNRREPGSGCPAIKGYNRIHAVLGGSNSCIAVHPSDMCVALVVLDAVIHLQGTGGERVVAAEKFFLEPGNHPERETGLQPGELITAVELPASSFAQNSDYLKVRDRTSFAFALVSVASAIETSGGYIKSARIALGGVATIPWRSHEAESVLVGKPLQKDTFRAAAEAAMHDAKPLKHNQFKIELAKRTIVRALSRLSNLT